MNRYCFVIGFDGIVEFLHLFEVDEEVVDVGVAEEKPGGWVLHVKHQG